MCQAFTRSIFSHAYKTAEWGSTFCKNVQGSRHIMKRGPGVIWVKRKCASGAWSKHKYNFMHSHEIRICYVYHGHCDSRDLCTDISAARWFYWHCLENSIKNKTINFQVWVVDVCGFCESNLLEMATHKRDFIVILFLEISSYWLCRWPTLATERQTYEEYQELTNAPARF